MNPSPGLTRATDLGPVVDRHTPARLAAQRVRNTLRLNALTSFVGGLFAAAAPGTLDRLLGTREPAWVRLVGSGLVVFSIGVAAVAGARVVRLMRWTRAIVAADAAWVAGSVATIIAGWYSNVGSVLVGAVAAMVAAFAARQTLTMSATHRLLSNGDDVAAVNESPPIEVVRTRRAVAAPRDHVWVVVTDHDLYGRLAMNLSNVHASTPNGPGLERTCRNRKGDDWHETCTLWEDGRRYEVAVDTTNYPYPLETMRGSWSVEPTTDPKRSIVGMDFRFQPTSGMVGRCFAASMHAAFPMVLSRIQRGWEREATRRAGTDGRR